jgi:hypothetical protein
MAGFPQRRGEIPATKPHRIAETFGTKVAFGTKAPRRAVVRVGIAAYGFAGVGRGRLGAFGFLGGSWATWSSARSSQLVMASSESGGMVV